MSSFDNNVDDTLDETASLWAARLEGSTLSPSDREALETWLNQHPRHRARLSQYCQLSADLEERLPALVAAGNVELPAETSVPARSRARLRWFVGASTLAAAAAVVLAFSLARPQAESSSIATSAAHRDTVTLRDGTQIDLNADTRLSIETNRTERRVRLVGGEAYFRVHKDPQRPFFVDTPVGSVRVTGTTFDVRAEATRFEVTVVEGSVQARPGDAARATPTKPVSLHAGQRLSADGENVHVDALPAAAVDDLTAWRQGQVVFDGTPLADALARFARYHGRSIAVADDAHALRISGRYSLDDLDGFLGGIEEPLNVHVTRDLGGNVRVTLRGQR
jgi:transmembrane sensor